MDEIQIYNYLNRVKPFFKKQEDVESNDKEIIVAGKAYPTNHTVILRYVGGIYKVIKNDKIKGGSNKNDINIILYD